MNSPITNFLTGSGSVLSVMPVGEVSYISVSKKSDAMKIAEDWKHVGKGMQLGMKTVSDEQNEKNRNKAK